METLSTIVIAKKGGTAVIPITLDISGEACAKFTLGQGEGAFTAKHGLRISTHTNLPGTIVGVAAIPAALEAETKDRDKLFLWYNLDRFTGVVYCEPRSLSNFKILEE